MKENCIEIRDVSFSYKESSKASLYHVSLNIREGEVVVLCGESGCGKSTLIRLINGLIPFYYQGELDGEVIVSGRSTKEGSIYDLGSKVSSVFQNPKSQFFCVDVRSELAFGAENRNFDKTEILKRMDQVSHELKLENLVDKTMFQLSGGEKQKIACASVSVTDNPIIVLDEPSSNLDMYAIAELKKIIDYWKQKGKTIVIAEHRLQYLLNTADRFLYLKNGRITREFQKDEIQQLSERELKDMGLRTLSYHHLVICNKKEAARFMTIRDFSFMYKGSQNPNLRIPELKIPEASVIAVIGKNGAGKSTFVRCFCGLEKRAKGTLLTESQSLRRKKRLEHSFLVMQDVNHQLFTESVDEEIILSMEKEDQGLLAELLKEFDLYDDRKRHPMSLSGGQKQRVAVASAVASSRDYIIFDEPTSGLDYFHMKQVSGCMEKLQKQGKTIFVITHDLELIYSCCNYVLHMESGLAKELYPLNEENAPKLKTFFNV